MALGQSDEANPIVKALITDQVTALDRWLAGHSEAPFATHHRMQIARYFDHPEEFVPASVSRLPDGSPIGSFSCDF